MTNFLQDQHDVWEILLKAAETGQWDQVSLEILQKVTPETLAIQDNDSRTLFHGAAGHGKLDKIPEWVWEKISSEALAIQDNGGSTLLHWAARNNQLKDIPASVQEKITPETLALQDDNGDTLLDTAASWNKLSEIPAWVWEKAPVSCLEEVKNNPEWMKKVPPEMAAIIDRRLSEGQSTTPSLDSDPRAVAAKRNEKPRT